LGHRKAKLLHKQKSFSGGSFEQASCEFFLKVGY
jgi:hypothetical protein